MINHDEYFTKIDGFHACKRTAPATTASNVRFYINMMIFLIRNDDFMLRKCWFYNKKVKAAEDFLDIFLGAANCNININEEFTQIFPIENEEIMENSPWRMRKNDFLLKNGRLLLQFSRQQFVHRLGWLPDAWQQVCVKNDEFSLNMIFVFKNDEILPDARQQQHARAALRSIRQPAQRRGSVQSVAVWPAYDSIHGQSSHWCDTYATAKLRALGWFNAKHTERADERYTNGLAWGTNHEFCILKTMNFVF